MLYNPLCSPKLTLVMERWCTGTRVFTCSHDWKVFRPHKAPDELRVTRHVKWAVREADGELVAQGKLLYSHAEKVEEAYDMDGTYYRAMAHYMSPHERPHERSGSTP